MVAVDARAFFRSDAEGEDGAFDLRRRRANGFPGLQRDAPGKLFVAVDNPLAASPTGRRPAN